MNKIYEKPYNQLFTKMLEEDNRIPTENSVLYNRQFDLYHFPNLEASSLNTEKKEYGTKHLIHDLSYMFTWIDLHELNRLVRAIFWLLSEGLRNYGIISIPEFGKFLTYDRATPVRYNMVTGERYSTRRMKLSRLIKFNPSTMLNALVVPREQRYATTSSYAGNWINTMFRNYVLDRKHRRQGLLLFQQVYNKKFTRLGYSKEYENALVSGEIIDDSFYTYQKNQQSM